MSDPKPLLIARELSTRLEAILTASGFNSDIGRSVVRGERQFSEVECPACSITIAEQTPASDGGSSYQVIAQVFVTGHVRYGRDHPEDTILRMCQDIHQAMELPIDPIGLRDSLIGRVKWLGDGDIDYPQDVGKVATATVAYEFSYRRQYGDP